MMHKIVANCSEETVLLWFVFFNVYKIYVLVVYLLTYMGYIFICI